MGKIAKILLDAIERCDCEISRIEALEKSAMSQDELYDLFCEKNNFVSCKNYLEKVLK